MINWDYSKVLRIPVFPFSSRFIFRFNNRTLQLILLFQSILICAIILDQFSKVEIDSTICYDIQGIRKHQLLQQPCENISIPLSTRSINKIVIKYRRVFHKLCILYKFSVGIRYLHISTLIVLPGDLLWLTYFFQTIKILII